MEPDENIDLGAATAAEEAAQAEAAAVAAPDPMAMLTASFSATTNAPVVPPAPAPAPVVEAPVLVPTAEAAAAAVLAESLRALPGLPPSLQALITGATVADVKQSYDRVRAGVAEMAALAVPAARGGTGPAPVPTDPFELLRQGYEQQARNRPA